MIKTIIALALAGTGIFLYLNTEDEKVEITQEKTKPLVQPSKVKESKKIEILYLEDEKTSEVKRTPKVKQTKEEEKDYEEESHKTLNYIKKNHLVNTNPKQTTQEELPIPEYSVYADITKEEAKAQYDKSLPPPAPAIVNGKTSDGSVYTVVIDGYINSVAKTKVVTKNSPDGEPIAMDSISSPKDMKEEDVDEVSQDEDEKVEIIAPPSIGY